MHLPGSELGSMRATFEPVIWSRGMGHRTMAAAAALTTVLALVSGCAEGGGELPLEPTAIDLATASSTLVECPTNETRSATKILGIFGGTVELDGHSVTLPFGAVALPTVLSVTAPAGKYVELDIQANDVETFTFRQPVSIRISYERCSRANLDDDALTAWYIDGDTKALLEHMGGTDDKTARAVTFSSDHLSAFAIAN